MLVLLGFNCVGTVSQCPGRREGLGSPPLTRKEYTHSLVLGEPEIRMNGRDLPNLGMMSMVRTGFTVSNL